MAAPNVSRIDVEGLPELRRALKGIDKKLPKLLQQANKLAVEPIAEDARTLYEREHPARRGRGRRSIRATATQTRAQIAMGGTKTPYMLGQEFGSGQGPRKRQFPMRRAVLWGVPRWRGGAGQREGSEGNFLAPAIRDGVATLGERYDKIIDEMVRPAFPKGRP